MDKAAGTAMMSPDKNTPRTRLLTDQPARADVNR